MISYINGVIFKKTLLSIVIETGGIGYEIFVSTNTIGKIGAVGDTALIYTHMKVSDDGISLFGFLTEEELNMFNSLIGVSGIGPKNAMALLSQYSPEAIISAVLTEDAQTLSKAQGIGKKTAARIILDLKDKFKASDIFPAGTTAEQAFKIADSAVSEAIDALMALGYSHADSTKAVMSLEIDGLNSSQLIRLALKKLSTL